MAATAEGDVTRSRISELEFVHTVDRNLVHRSALSELFLTDSRQVDEERFVAGAQLPSSHAYYADHTGPAPVDPLLLLECCRQAETHAVHAHFDAPGSVRFVLSSWSMTLSDLASVSPGPGPVELVMAVSTHDGKWRDGALRSLEYTVHLHVAGRYVGETRICAEYVPAEVYDAMRGRNRSGRLPTSQAFQQERPDGEPVPPARVGRTQPDNVVLLDAVSEPGFLRARMRIAGGHPSLFDHAQDHHPGMVLMEAARQMSVLAAGTFGIAGPDSCFVTAMDASFTAYAELDSPVLLTTRQIPSETGAFGARLHTAFEQDGVTIANATFTVADGLPPAAGAGS